MKRELEEMKAEKREGKNQISYTNKFEPMPSSSSLDAVPISWLFPALEVSFPLIFLLNESAQT
jgi:hypothetical protein